MELKNAVAVCLIALFSATIVVLIARALDSQAASQLEPQLTAIAEELRAIRKQGGIGAPVGDATVVEGANNGLVVYYLHGSYRCPTCRTVEAEAKKIVETEFASQVQRGEITFKALDYEKPLGAELARHFKVSSSVIVLVTMKDGKIDHTKSKRLDKVLPLAARDVTVLDAYLRGEIKAMLPAETTPTGPALKAESPTPVPPKPDFTPSDGSPPSVPIPE
jgi:hypothetical protein